MSLEGAGPTPDKNGDMFQAPSPARQGVPGRTGWAATGGGPYKGKRNLALQETACEADAWQHDSLGVLV